MDELGGGRGERGRVLGMLQGIVLEGSKHSKKMTMCGCV